MFYQMAEDGKEPTEFQIARLRSYEITQRINAIIMEGVDLGTDLAFMFVLFDQAGDIELPLAWQFYKATNKCPGNPFGGEEPSFFRSLGIASAVFIGISCFFRLATALGTVLFKFSEINGLREWGWTLLGCLVSIVDPWNGSLMINQVIEKQRLERDDYVLAKSEIKADIYLVILENLPQIIIQIIYGVRSGQANSRAIAWYVAIFTTVLHTTSQLFEIFHLSRKLPELYQAAKQGKGSAPSALAAVEDDKN